MTANIKHLYIHIPFCRSKCPYCDFFSIPNASENKKSSYVAAVIREFAHLSKLIAVPLETVYLGGGSPILLGPKNLSIILGAISPFTNPNTEKSIELNPEHVEEEMFNFDFNRISLGVQTVDLDILKKIKRKYDLDKLVQNIKRIKRENISVSLDFMFGLPGQGLAELKRDIDFIDEHRPEHISFYLFTPPRDYEYIYECAADELAEEMFHTIHNSILKLGYGHYEISNYSLKAKECKHNMAYWERKSYLGLGAAAHSFLSDKKQRSWHAKDVDAYIEDPFSYEAQEKLDSKMELNEKIMLGLRLLNIGVEESLLDGKDYLQFLKKGLIRSDNGQIFLTEKGIPLLDCITAEFLS